MRRAAKPDELTLASAGPGSSTHIALEMLKRAANVKMTYVPYQGSTSAVNALLGGYVTAVLASYPNVVEQIKAGKLRALATTSSTRIKQLPEVPTVAESGFQKYGSDIWFGVIAPARHRSYYLAASRLVHRSACRCRKSKPSLKRKAYRGSVYAGASLAPLSANSMTQPAVQFARPILVHSSARFRQGGDNAHCASQQI